MEGANAAPVPDAFPLGRFRPNRNGNRTAHSPPKPAVYPVPIRKDSDCVWCDALVPIGGDSELSELGVAYSRALAQVRMPQQYLVCGMLKPGRVYLLPAMLCGASLMTSRTRSSAALP